METPIANAKRKKRQPKKQARFSLPLDVYQAIKRRAVDEDRKACDVVAEMLQAGLSNPVKPEDA